MRRRDFIRLVSGLAGAWPPLAARAQQVSRIYRIAYLAFDDTSDATIVKQRLEELGYEEGKKVFQERSVKRLLDPAASEKLTALAWNCDPRQIKTHRRARSAGARSALGKKLAEERVLMPALRLLADRVASRLWTKYLPGPTVTVRVRFGDLRSVTLGNAGCADFGDCCSFRNRRGTSAQGARAAP